MNKGKLIGASSKCFIYKIVIAVDQMELRKRLHTLHTISVNLITKK